MSDTASQPFPTIQNPPLNGEHRPVMKKVPGGGRPSLDSYLEPEETEEIAVTAERIQENYPFFGTLLKQENGIYRRKEVISRHSPQTIEQIEQRFGGGKYQVRLKKESGGEEQIHFSIPEASKPATSHVQPAAGDQHFMESIRRDVREETRQEFEQIIDTLERRIKAKDAELDDLTGKVRRMTMNLAEAERQSISLVSNKTSTYQTKIEQLKEEIQTLKFENFELQQELKYADVDAGFDFKEVLNDALKNPDLFKLVAPLLAKFQPQPPVALADPAASNPEAETPSNQSESSTEQTQQEKMQHMINQFFTSVVQTVSSAMLKGTPGPDGIQKTVRDGIRSLEGVGIKPEPQFWIQVSQTLIDFALKNSISAQKAADTISPVLQQVNGAAEQLRYVTPGMAAEYIINKFGIDVTGPQKEFLTEVLKVFKSQLKTNV